MKKVLSISMVALLAMAPTMGWAKEPAVATGTNDLPTTMNSHNITDSTSNNTYVTDRSSELDSGITATPTTGASYKKKGDNGVRPIVDPAKPKYNVESITEDDGARVAAVSYVKGAYNDLITKVNRVASETSGGDIKVFTTWGNIEEVKTIKLEQEQQQPEE